MTHPGMCTFKHIPKLNTKLAAGFYILPAVGWGGASIYISPTISAATTSASLGFFSIRDTSTSLATMNRLFMAANDRSLDKASPQDIKAVIGMEDDESAPNSKTPCKRVKLRDEDYADHHNSLGEDTIPTSSRWKTVEHEFASVTHRHQTVEGSIRLPAPGVNASSLWSDVHTSDTRLSAIEVQLGPRLSSIEGQLGTRLENRLLLLQRGADKDDIEGLPDPDYRKCSECRGGGRRYILCQHCEDSRMIYETPFTSRSGSNDDSESEH